MTGTREGGLRAAETIRKKHGEDFYKEIGAEGGKLGTSGGFASKTIGSDGLTGPQRARKAGRLGGRQRRKKNGI